MRKPSTVRPPASRPARGRGDRAGARASVPRRGAISPLSILLPVLLVVIGPIRAASGQARSAGWELGVHAGALRVDDDFADRFSSTTGLVVAATAAWIPDPRAFLEAEAWRWVADPSRDPPGGPGGGELDLWGAGFALGVSPLAGRRRIDPHLLFGVETVRASDEERRSVAYVAGGGVRARVADRWVARIDLRNHFLTVDEDEVDGVETGRDASLWELRGGIAVRFGGGR